MKKILRFEVEDFEEGGTECCRCPFAVWDEYKGISCNGAEELLKCYEYNLSTLKFIGEERYESKS